MLASDLLPQPPQRCDSRQVEIQFAASPRMDCIDACPHSAVEYGGEPISSYRSAPEIIAQLESLTYQMSVPKCPIRQVLRLRTLVQTEMGSGSYATWGTLSMIRQNDL